MNLQDTFIVYSKTLEVHFTFKCLVLLKLYQFNVCFPLFLSSISTSLLFNFFTEVACFFLSTLFIINSFTDLDPQFSQLKFTVDHGLYLVLIQVVLITLALSKLNLRA